MKMINFEIENPNWLPALRAFLGTFKMRVEYDGLISAIDMRVRFSGDCDMPFAAIEEECLGQSVKFLRIATSALDGRNIAEMSVAGHPNLPVLDLRCDGSPEQAF